MRSVASLSWPTDTDTEAGVDLLVVDDTDRDDNRIVYPLNPDHKPLRPDAWGDAPSRE